MISLQENGYALTGTLKKNPCAIIPLSPTHNKGNQDTQNGIFCLPVSKEKEDNMTCENKVSYYLTAASGFTTREYLVRCGLTAPYGMRAICDECLSDPRKMAEIQRHEDDIKADNQAAASAGWGEF